MKRFAQRSRSALPAQPDRGAVARQLRPRAPADTERALDAAGLLRRAARLGHRPPSRSTPARFRTSPSTIRRGGGDSKPDDETVLQEVYAKQVRAATAKVGNTLTAFGAAPEGRFDGAAWETVDDLEYVQAIRAKIPLEIAISAIFSHPDRWSFDCAEWVQVVNLYATLKTYGKRAFEKVAPHDLLLRQHNSPPLGTSFADFERTTASAPFDLILPQRGNLVARGFIDEEALLAGLPVGSRVCFKNDPIANDTAYRNENALKDGPGTFAAHPLGRGLSREFIVGQLADFNLRQFDADHRDGIFISQAEIYGTIPVARASFAALGLDRISGGASGSSSGTG